MANFDSLDLQQNHKIASVAYIPFLFFVPMIMNANSRVGRYCANQGLLLLLAWVAGGIVGWALGWIPLIGALIRTILGVYNFAVAAISLYYAYMMYSKADVREVPVIGGVTLIR